MKFRSKLRYKSLAVVNRRVSDLAKIPPLLRRRSVQWAWRRVLCLSFFIPLTILCFCPYNTVALCRAKSVCDFDTFIFLLLTFSQKKPRTLLSDCFSPVRVDDYLQAAYRAGKCSCLLDRLLESRDSAHLLTDSSLAVTDDDVRCLFVDILVAGKNMTSGCHILDVYCIV